MADNKLSADGFLTTTELNNPEEELMDTGDLSAKEEKALLQKKPENDGLLDEEIPCAQRPAERSKKASTKQPKTNELRDKQTEAQRNQKYGGDRKRRREADPKSYSSDAKKSCQEQDAIKEKMASSEHSIGLLKTHLEKGTCPKTLRYTARANITPDEDFKNDIGSIRKKAENALVGALRFHNRQHFAQPQLAALDHNSGTGQEQTAITWERTKLHENKKRKKMMNLARTIEVLKKIAPELTEGKACTKEYLYAGIISKFGKGQKKSAAPLKLHVLFLYKELCGKPTDTRLEKPTCNEYSYDKSFFKGLVSFSHIEPTVGHAKRKLQSISSEATPIKQLQEDFKPGGRLSAIDLTPTVNHFVEMDKLFHKYIANLIANFNNHYKKNKSKE
ncbi:hypothetical protein ACROYT_G014028 [Oculina patagonica]